MLIRFLVEGQRPLCNKNTENEKNLKVATHVTAGLESIYDEPFTAS